MNGLMTRVEFQTSFILMEIFDKDRDNAIIVFVSWHNRAIVFTQKEQKKLSTQAFYSNFRRKMTLLGFFHRFISCQKDGCKFDTFCYCRFFSLRIYFSFLEKRNGWKYFDAKSPNEHTMEGRYIV